MLNHDVIAACDFKDRAALREFLVRFKDVKPFFKIGMELFYAEGPDIVREVRGAGHDVFLDLKLCDIPNTVKSAMRVIAKLDVQIVNVHAFGTMEMMSAALDGLNEGGGKRPLLIAVTQLTSTDEVRMRKELLINAAMEETVGHYALNAKEAGLDGVVCSPLEASLVKARCGKDFITVTPGIRYAASKTDDQSRVTTPGKAREIGCDYIVVGRPITAAEDPLAAYTRIRKEFLGEE